MSLAGALTRYFIVWFAAFWIVLITIHLMGIPGDNATNAVVLAGSLTTVIFWFSKKEGRYFTVSQMISLWTFAFVLDTVMRTLGTVAYFASIGHSLMLPEALATALTRGGGVFAATLIAGFIYFGRGAMERLGVIGPQQTVHPKLPARAPDSTATGRRSTTQPWPYEIPPNTACLTVRDVMTAKRPILRVHRDTDGGWQFLPGIKVTEQDALTVGLGEIFKLDNSIASVADMAPGSDAVRESQYSPWRRQALG
jgi:hypothetical protein